MRRWQLRLALSACMGWLAREVPADPAGPDRSNPVHAEVGPALARALPRHHLSKRSLDEEMGRRALEIFFEMLDPERAYFTVADLAEMRARAGRFEESLRRGDLSFAREAFGRLKQRVADRVRFAEDFLSSPLPDTTGLTYRWRRRNEPWPADETERDDLWRRKLINEVMARRVVLHFASEQPADGEAPELEEEPPEHRRLTAEQFVLRRYRQFLQLLEDSDDEWIADRFFSSFTQAYDPHSEYLSAIRSEDFDINMRLSLTGIGAVLTSEDGLVRVVRLIPGGPAERDGRLRPNDRIVAVAQGDDPPVEVIHWPLYKVVRLIRGPPGTKVVLTVWPASDPTGGTEKKVELIREEVRLEDKAANGQVCEVKDGRGQIWRLGVLKLPEFYADFKGLSNGEAARRAATDVRQWLEKMTSENGGIDGLVLDLRNNGGGSLPDAVELAGLFIRGGPIVQVRGSGGVQVLSDPDERQWFDGPLVVLVNRLSASASEIVAAALQDYRRAVIVGDSKTHGKGTVQTVLPLNPRDERLGTLKVTTAMFYRISGGSTQRRGVSPDVVISSLLDAAETGEEYLPHALEWSVVDPVFHVVYGRAVPPLEWLRSASEARRAGDPRFEALDRLRAQIAERTRAGEVPLDWEARLAYSRAERELERAERELEGEGRPTREGDWDIVLDEALQILADMAAWRREVTAAVPTGESPSPAPVEPRPAP